MKTRQKTEVRNDLQTELVMHMKKQLLLLAARESMEKKWGTEGQ
jgi:hypothetical protein